MAIVCREHGYIFIHIYKTAGNAVMKAMGMPEEMYLGAHVDIRDVRRALTEAGEESFFESAVKFAFVRNPFDWLVSTYHHMKTWAEGYRQKPVKEQDMTFSQWLDYYVLDLMQREQPAGSNKIQRLVDFVNDENGEQLVDFVGRYESLEQNVEHLCRRLEIPFNGVPMVNVNPERESRDYRPCYGAEEQRLVEEHFAADLEAFGYEF